MDSQEIAKKVTQLQSIMSRYKHDLGILKKELNQAISEYQKALEEEKLKEIRQNLS